MVAGSATDDHSADEIQVLTAAVHDKRSQALASLATGTRDRGGQDKSLPLKAEAQAAPDSQPTQWTPWMDRVRSHRDAVLLVEVCCDHTLPEDDPGRRCLFTAAADGTARLFELSRVGAQPRVRQRLSLPAPAHGSGVLDATPRRSGSFCTAFAYRGPRPLGEETRGAAGGSAKIFVGYDCGRVICWDSYGQLAAELAGHERAISALRCCEGEADLVSASHDSTVCAWRLANGTQEDGGGRDCGVSVCLFVLSFGQNNPVSDLALLSGHRIVASTWDGRLRSIDLYLKACTNIVQASDCSLRALCASEDGAFVFVGTEDCNIKCWHFPAEPGPTGQSSEVLSWKAHRSQVTLLRLWRDRLFSASEDRSVRLWEASTGALLEEFCGHSGAVLTMCVSSGDQLLWTGGRDWSVRSWDLAELELRIDERARMLKMDQESASYKLHNWRLPHDLRKKEATAKGKAKAKAKAQRRGASPRDHSSNGPSPRGRTSRGRTPRGTSARGTSARDAARGKKKAPLPKLV
mmetsp:Transcript_68806/g.149755  ORF Transcript_68806/g.149755 Transcript_68806/m.149755 type:complete len:520 (-) Transcript_68806:320-1879(-)